jgi:carboxymethylenebutenolidase
MRPFKTLMALVLLIGICAGRADFVDAQREVVMFQSGHWTFNGYIYRPEGKGPFPAVIWNHGHHEHLTTKQPAEYEEMAKLFTRDGIVLFIPDRHVHDISRSDYSLELQKMLNAETKGVAVKLKEAEEEAEINANDVVAAFEWLKSQPYIDAKRVAVSGWSSGACASLAAADKCHGFRAIALFSPRITTWKGNPALQESLLRAVQNASVPIFVVLASDEPESPSTTALTKEVENSTTKHRVETYEHAGYRAQEKTALIVNGVDIWGYDVLRFVQEAIKD